MPSYEDLIHALNEPGRLIDKPVIQELLRERDERWDRDRPRLTLIQGGGMTPMGVTEGGDVA